MLIGTTCVPGWCSIKSLGSIVPALTVSSHDKNLVTRPVTASVAVEVLDILLKSLPLSLVALSGVLRVCGVCAVQETKVPLSLYLLVDDIRVRGEAHT